MQSPLSDTHLLIDATRPTALRTGLQHASRLQLKWRTLSINTYRRLGKQQQQQLLLKLYFSSGCAHAARLGHMTVSAGTAESR